MAKKPKTLRNPLVFLASCCLFLTLGSLIAFSSSRYRPHVIARRSTEEMSHHSLSLPFPCSPSEQIPLLREATPDPPSLNSPSSSSSNMTLFTVLNEWDDRHSSKFCGVLLNTLNSIRSYQHSQSFDKIILFGDYLFCDYLSRVGLLLDRKTSCLPIPASCLHPQLNVPIVSCIFSAAGRLATTEFMVYTNSDIVFASNIANLTHHVASHLSNFLIVGRRTDRVLSSLLNFQTPRWLEVLQGEDDLHGDYGMDYFIFRRSKPPKLSPFLLGRVLWDNCLVASYIGHPQRFAVDATKVLTAYHLNHPGKSSFKEGSEVNAELCPEESKLIGSISLSQYLLARGNDSLLSLDPVPLYSFKALTKRYKLDSWASFATFQEGQGKLVSTFLHTLRSVGVSKGAFAHYLDPKVGKALGFTFPSFLFVSKNSLEFEMAGKATPAFLKNVQADVEVGEMLAFGNVTFTLSHPRVIEYTQLALGSLLLKHNVSFILCDPKIRFRKNPIEVIKKIKKPIIYTSDPQGLLRPGFLAVKAEPDGIKSFRQAFVKLHKKFKTLKTGEDYHPNLISYLDFPRFLREKGQGQTHHLVSNDFFD